MNNMEIQDFDDLYHPSRKPWILLILLILAGAFVFYHYKIRNRKKSSSEEISSREISQKEISSKHRIPERSAHDKKTAEAHSSDAHLLTKAKTTEIYGKLVEARGNYLSALEHIGKGQSAADIERRLAEINVKLIFTPRSMPGKIAYVVQRGNSVQRIARKFGTTSELIQKSNNLKNANLIKVGDQLMVLNHAVFKIKVSKAQNSLVLYMNDGFFKRYPISTGEYGKTPAGTFSITDKIEKPPWWHPNGKLIPYGDKANILGTRWMTLRATGNTPNVRGYGIHGTSDKSSIGKSVSRGCIRMKNNDIEELFAMVPYGTFVEIVE